MRFRPNWRTCCTTTSAGLRRSITPADSASSAAVPRSGSSAKTSTTPVRTRSTTRSARRCSPSGWARQRVIAETGAGQHGVATATACARFGLPCVIYMGEEDIRRQAPNVFSMRLLGAEVRPVSSGSRTLRDAINEAMRDWMASVEQHALHPRFGRRTASVSADRARFPVGDRTRDDPAVPRPTRATARSGRGLRGRRQQRRRDVLSVRRGNRRAAGGRRGGRPRCRSGRTCRAAELRQSRRVCTAVSAT